MSGFKKGDRVTCEVTWEGRAQDRKPSVETGTLHSIAKGGIAYVEIAEGVVEVDAETLERAE